MIEPPRDNGDLEGDPGVDHLAVDGLEVVSTSQEVRWPLAS